MNTQDCFTIMTSGIVYGFILAAIFSLLGFVIYELLRVAQSQ